MPDFSKCNVLTNEIVRQWPCFMFQT